jgi:hypothetical protein
MLLLYVSLLSLDPKKATQEVMNATSCPPDACIQHHSTAGSAQKRWAKFILMTMPVPSPSTCASASDLGSDAIFAIYCKSLHRCTLHEGH